MSLTGLESVLAGMAAAEEEIDHAAPEGMRLAGERIRTAWQDGIASEGLILTGRYHDSIAVRVEEKEVTVGTDVPYAPILEHGDSRQAAHPVAQRALEEQGEAGIGDVAEHLRTVLR